MRDEDLKVWPFLRCCEIISIHDVTAYLLPFYQPFAMFNFMIHSVVNAEYKVSVNEDIWIYLSKKP